MAVWCCRWCNVAGGEQVPLAPLGWYYFRKLEFNISNNVYSNKSPFKYHISILGGWGYEAMLILLI